MGHIKFGYIAPWSSAVLQPVVLSGWRQKSSGALRTYIEFRTLPTQERRGQFRSTELISKPAVL
jgi:hypothetical protein